MSKKRLSPMPQSADALAVLGQQIRSARHARGWTIADLARRVGVSPPTVSGVEKGAPGSSIGTVFDAATILGVPLFSSDGAEVAMLRRHGEHLAALIPSRVVPPKDDDDGLDF